MKTKATAGNHPSLTDLFSYIDDHEQSYIDRLIDYLRHPSISAHGIGIRQVAGILRDWLAGIGLTAELKETAGFPMVVGRRIEDIALPTLLIYGHYDVQPPDPLELWHSPPFEPTIRDGRLFARGVGDNKGQHAAYLFAIETLLALNNKLPCNVIVLLEGEEEVGSPHIEPFINAHKAELDADLVIISDGPVEQDGRSTIEFGVRGILSFELRAQGANQDLHSGNWGGVAPNPLWTLVHLLGTMKNEQGLISIDGFFDSVAPANQLEKNALAHLPVDEESIKRELGLAEFDAPHERGFFERLALFPTLTINGLHGGYGGKGTKTVLPCRAAAKCDMRLVANQTVAEAFALVEAHVKKYAPQVELIYQGGMDPSKTPLDSPFAAPIKAAMAAAQGQEPLLRPAMGGSLPNYVFTRDLRLHAFVIPFANHDESNHAPNENMELWRIKMGIKTAASLLIHLGEMAK